MNHHFTSLVWVKNDLRIRDNPALSLASHERGPTVALYVLDEPFYKKWHGGDASLARLKESLVGFESSLRDHGIPLLALRGNPKAVIKETLRSLKIGSIYWNEGLEPSSLDCEKKLKEELEREHISVRVLAPNLLIDRESFYTRQGTPFRLFTPFWKTAIPLLQDMKEVPLPQKQTFPLEGITVESEEKKAWKRLSFFSKNELSLYALKRDLLGEDRTSHLSTHLHFGEISVRSVYLKTREDSEFVRQLLWRDFAHYLLHHFPDTMLKRDLAPFSWRKDQSELLAWQRGMTGIPIVDAGMRQLQNTGWMPNRARMIVASFLTKHLLHHWTEGMDWFWETLLDADLANNTFGWQWVAGCGIDAAPFFRIMNPLLQAQRFDAKGTYVRTWLPELSLLPDPWIHKPWEAKQSLLDSCRVTLGKTYPLPIVSLQDGRKRALNTYFSSRKGSNLLV